MSAKKTKKLSNEKNGVNNEFLASMSHEIRTSMNAIVGMSDLILRDSSDDETLQNAMQIRSASESLLSIINDIIDFSKMENGSIEIIDESFMPAEMIYKVINSVQGKIAEKNLTFETDISKEIPRLLISDEGRIRQIIISLLNNAVKFTEKGSIKLSGKAEPSETPGNIHLYFCVEDTGIGIKDVDRDKLFAGFSQIDAMQNIAIQGSGLGLAISKHLCEQLGGRIGFETEYGKGSKFFFYIDCRVSDSTPIGDSLKEYAKIEVKPKYAANFTAPEALILVVDDSKVNLKVATGIMRPFGMKIDTVTGGEAAIDKVIENDYDIIFMDHMMPGMDGVEATGVLRVMEKCRNVPIIALTANAIAGSKEFYLENGFDGYISKPMNINEVEAVLAKYIPDNKKVISK